MRVVFNIMIAVALVVLSGPAPAQQPAPAETPNTGAVTVLTDGIADPSGRVSRGFSELSLYLDQAGKLRVLPLMGYGGVANVRDLLKLRGADFAILNNDILAYLALTKTYPEASRRIRFVTHLYDERVYLIARNQIKTVADLKGRKVAVTSENSPGNVTARTVLGTLKVNATLVPFRVTGDVGLLKDVDAFLLLERDAARLPNNFWRSGEYRLMSLPPAGELAKIYRPAAFGDREFPDLQPAAGQVQTLKAETLLVVFDWAPTQGRFGDVTRFVDALMTALPQMRQKLPDTFWPETSLKTAPLGWQRYAPAEARLKTLPAASLGATRTSQQPRRDTAGEKPALAPAPVAAPAGSTAAIRLSAIARPPLTESKKPNGGFIADLTLSALRASGYRDASEPSLQWMENGGRQLEDLLTKNTTDVALPWVAPDCEHPETLGPSSALICDGTLLSAPLFQAVYTFFVRTDGDFHFENDESISQRIICVPENHDLTDLNGPERRWVSEGKIKLVRPATLIDCFGLVEKREADAVLVNELEGHFVVERLGLSQVFQVTPRAVANHSVVAVVAKTNPKAEEFIRAINAGIAQLKQGEQYAQIVGKSLSELWQRGNVKQ